MKKRILAMLMTLSMIATMLPTVALAAETPAVYTPTNLFATTDDGQFRIEWEGVSLSDSSSSGMKIAFFDASGNEVYSYLTGAYSWRNYWELGFETALEEGFSATSVGIHIANVDAYSGYSYNEATGEWEYEDTSAYWAGLAYSDYTIVPNAAINVNYVEKDDIIDIAYSYDGVDEDDDYSQPYVGFQIDNSDNILNAASHFRLGYMLGNYAMTGYDFVSTSGYYNTSKAAYFVEDFWEDNDDGWYLGLGDGSTNYIDYLLMTYSITVSNALYTQTFTRYDTDIDFTGYDAPDTTGIGDKPTGITIATGKEVDDAAGSYGSSDWLNSMSEPILTWDQAADDATDGTDNWYPNGINPDTDGKTKETTLEVYYNDGTFSNASSTCEYRDITSFRGTGEAEYRVTELRLGYWEVQTEEWKLDVYTSYIPDITVKQVIGETKDIVLYSTEYVEEDNYTKSTFYVYDLPAESAADFTYWVDGESQGSSNGGVGNWDSDGDHGSAFGTNDSNYGNGWNEGLGDGYQEGESWTLDVYSTDIIDNGDDPDGYVVTITRYPLNVVTDTKEKQDMEWSTEGDLETTYGSTATGYTASTTGDGAITYSSSDETVVSVNEDTGALTIIGAGTATITATAASTETYRVATASYDITVAPLQVDIAVADSAITFGEDISSDLVENVPGLVAGDFVSDLDITLTALDANVGTTSYTATLGNANYTAGTVTGTLTITKAAAPTVDTLAVTPLYTGVYGVSADVTLVLPSDSGALTVNGYYIVSDDSNIISAVALTETGLSLDTAAGTIGDSATIEIYVSMGNYDDTTVTAVVTLIQETIPGGGSSSSGTGSTTTSGSTVSASGTTSNGTTSVTVSSSSIAAAVDAGEDTVEISVNTKSSTTAVELTMPAEALSTIADSDVKSLVISSNIGTIEISSDAAESIAQQAGDEDVTIALNAVDTSSALNETQKTIVGDAIVYDLSITVGDETISSFGGAAITITLPYQLKEGESAENIVIWYIDDLGNIAPMESVYDEDTGTVTFVTTHFSLFAVMHDTNPFADIDPNDWFYSSVLWAVENGITNGTSDTNFSPDDTCTRAEAVTFLYRAAGGSAEADSCSFTDVDDNAYYYDAVLWAVANGITAGATETTFAPEDTCTRDQIVTFLYRLAGQPEVTGETTFTDVDSDAYYYDAVLWAVENDITTGTGEGAFSPSETCTRGQIVTFLYRYLGE